MKDLLDQNLIDHNSFVPAEVIFSPIATLDMIKNILVNQLKIYDV